MQSVVEVFGTALASYYNGNKFGELIVREDNEAVVIPTANFFKSPDDVAMDKIALSYCEDTVINIDAGSGEHSLYLLAKGMTVYSLDNSPIACAIMHQRGVPAVFCGHIFEQYMQFDRVQTWLAMSRAIGQLGNMKNLLHFLDLVHHHLLPFGRLILSSENIHSEGYRMRHISVEFDGKKSERTPWLDVGISTLKHIAK